MSPTDPTTDASTTNQLHPTAAPVMDIKAPAKTLASEPVKTPPPEPEETPAESTDPKPQPEKTPKPPRPPKQPGSGIGLAICATVIIVVSLAGLFVYAYLRTMGIKVF